ncbi:MAG: hypothetical protein K6A23_11520 [Butyrivibrio sp.]|nr:hypothetical protein [Butyrivibrio sp.]
MAYKISYKVVSQQGEQLKNIAKDMDNYVTQLNQIISKLGNDELLQSVRTDLNKFSKQLEEEKTVLNLAGQIIVDVIQSYTGTEKKTVQKVDKAKAHNRDFYKRAVAVASAGGVTASAGASAASYGGAAAASASVTSNTVNVNTTNVVQESTTIIMEGVSGAASTGSSGINNGAATVFTSAAASNLNSSSGSGVGASTVAAAASAVVSGVAAAGGAIGGVLLSGKKKDTETIAEGSPDEKDPE